MQNLLVHFSQQQQPDQPLRPGVQRIVRQANGSVRLGDAGHGALLLAQFCMDDRGLWLQVGNGIRGIHVNGRPVRRMALLRAGDAVYVDGVEMVLQGEVTLGWDGRTQTFRPGDVFTMARDCPHTEQFGPEGAVSLVGRKR